MIAYKASLVASCKSQVLFSLAIDESRLLNREENVQVSDTTEVDSSITVGKQKISTYSK